MSAMAILIAIGSGLAVNECCELSPWAADKLVRWSAHLRYSGTARESTRAEELAALVSDRPGKLFKLITASGFAVTAVVSSVRYRSAVKLRRWQILELPILLRLYVIGLTLLYAGAVTAAGISTHFYVSGLLLFALLLACLLCTVEIHKREQLRRSAPDLNLAYSWLLPAALLLPPIYGLAAPALLMVAQQFRIRRIPPHRRVFTTAAMGLGTGAASIIFHALTLPGGWVASSPGSSTLVWMLVASGCGIIQGIINSSFVVAAVKGSDPGFKICQLMFNRRSVGRDTLELCVAVAASIAIAQTTLLAIPVLALISAIEVTRASRARSLGGPTAS